LSPCLFVSFIAMTRRALPTWALDPRLHIAIILLVAAFFRLWQLDRIPPGLFGDEATDGLDALDVLAGRGAVFFPANYGREGLHMWIVAAAFQLMGVTPLALRLPSAIAGIVTALATYWLGRELAKYYLRSPDAPPLAAALAPLNALAAALYAATSFWHVHVSRFGVRGVFTPMCGALAFAALWRAFNASADDDARRSYLWAAGSGLFLGLSLHFYTASRFYPIFLGVFLLLQALIGRERSFLRSYWRQFALLLAIAALVFLPLSLYFLQHPGSFMQRASEVAVTGNENPFARMAQAALANVLQFGVPGRGDTAQFYNLPGRPVFDLLAAALALVGLIVLLRHGRRAPALFLLTWMAVMVAPAFLATDRFPTLPRVLGVIPAVYFFPAVGLMTVSVWLWRLAGEKRAWVPALFAAVALVLSAGLTYRDYFRVWGPSAATFEAFEGDMAAAWQWLEANEPAGHVFLSSDIYRHPTFMLLGERATVSTYFQHHNPALSWFDARTALPLPPDGQPATYLIGGSAPVQGLAAEYLAANGVARDRVAAPEGGTALEVVELPATRETYPSLTQFDAPIPMTDALALDGADTVTAADGAATLRLLWHMQGPETENWHGYRLEFAGDGWEAASSLDAFRPTEWVPGGSFVTAHPLDAPVASSSGLRLRLLNASDRTPIVAPSAPDGWRALP
jgi:4-amino-4-deoxy-L-arabinose transferase-like glycosyltransferase